MPKSHKATRGKAGRRARLRRAATRKHREAEEKALLNAVQKYENELARNSMIGYLNTSTNSENEIIVEMAKTKARKQVHGSPSRSPRGRSSPRSVNTRKNSRQ
jgi:hypothetical protein